MSDKSFTITDREGELAAYLEQQPYMAQLDGVTLKIAKNVFPSNFGLTSSFVGNFILQQPAAENALDMACGSGYFAFLLKKIGCSNVVGADFNIDAISCARENIGFNPELAPIAFIHSNLFNNVPKIKFGLIVFNFNYYPSTGVFGLNADGGREILERFFSQAHDYINSDTRIYIPYSQFVGERHDPKMICTDYGFSIVSTRTTVTETGEHYIYLIMLN